MNSNFIPNGRTQLLALFGGQLSQSPSPATHSRWAQKAGLNFQYSALQANSDEEFLALVNGLIKSPHFAGGNITNPFKSTALKIDGIEIEPPAVRCGAGNTLYRVGANSEACWHLTNTDLFGCSESLKEILREKSPRAEPVSVVILGRGAMMKTCLCALEDIASEFGSEFRVTIAARASSTQINNARVTQSNRKLTIQTVDINNENWTSVLSSSKQLICINTLPSLSSYEAEQVTRSAIQQLESAGHWQDKNLFCITYGLQPWHKWAETLHWNVFNGNRLFECQARASFKLWTGCDAPTLPTALELA